MKTTLLATLATTLGSLLTNAAPAATEATYPVLSVRGPIREDTFDRFNSLPWFLSTEYGGPKEGMINSDQRFAVELYGERNTTKCQTKFFRMLELTMKKHVPGPKKGKKEKEKEKRDGESERKDGADDEDTDDEDDEDDEYDEDDEDDEADEDDKSDKDPQMTHGKTRNLTQVEFDAWKTPAHFAAVSYCTPENVKAWSCGSHCEALGGVKVVAYGGGGKDNKTSFWYVALQDGKAYVLVQGTTKKFGSIMNDLEIVHVDARETYFPGIGKAQVHDGFYGGFTRMGRKIAIALDQVIKKERIKEVVVIGHSQGAGVAQILAVGLHNFLPRVKVHAQVFAPPRVGDPDWANYVDGKMGLRSQYMVAERDPVPHIPRPETLGMEYRHSSNEIWIPDVNGTQAIFCSGQENAKCSNQLYFDSALKTTKAVIDWRRKKITTHRGPFNGVYIKCDKGK